MDSDKYIPTFQRNIFVATIYATSLVSLKIGNIDAVSSQQMYKKTCFRIDVDNLYGTNFKQ